MNYEEFITKTAQSEKGIITVVGTNSALRKEMLTLYSEKLPENSKLFVISDDTATFSHAPKPDEFSLTTIQVISPHPAFTLFENLNRALKAAVRFDATHIAIDSNMLEGLQKAERYEIFELISELAQKVNITMSFPDSSFVDYYKLYILDTFGNSSIYGERWRFVSQMLGIIIIDFQQIDVESPSNILAVEFEYQERLALDYDLEIDYLVEVITGFVLEENRPLNQQSRH